MIPEHARGGDERLPLWFLGMVPAVAVSGRVIDALWMSAGVLAVSVLASVARSFLESADGPGSPAEDSARRLLRALLISSVLTAGFEAVLLAVAPAASAALGIYAPLVAVNLLALDPGGGEGRSAAGSAARALARGTLFAAALVAIALMREVLGAGTITLFPVGGFRGTIAIGSLPDQPVRALGLAGGALLCLGYLGGAIRLVTRRSRAGEEPR